VVVEQRVDDRGHQPNEKAGEYAPEAKANEVLVVLQADAVA